MFTATARVPICSSRLTVSHGQAVARRPYPEGMGDLVFNRVVSDALMQELGEGGRFHEFVARALDEADVVDVQLRREPRGRRSWATLYVGLTSILDLDERAEQYRLRADATHRAKGGFAPGWNTWQSASHLAASWPQISKYLDTLLAGGGVANRLWEREGVVHAALCSGRSDAYTAVQREARVSAASTAASLALASTWRQAIYNGIRGAGRTDPWWPGVRDHGEDPPLGLKADLIGVDPLGRLLVVEAKPSTELKGLTWGPAQVRIYAEQFAALLDDNDEAGALLNKMAHQRHQLGLSGPPFRFADQESLRVVPVLAIGAGPRSPVALDRLQQVAEALQAIPPANGRIDPLEVWLLDPTGHPVTIWRPALEPNPATRVKLAGRARAATSPQFVAAARAAALAWKQSTGTLEDPQREPAAYGRGRPLPFCLPDDARPFNLLPEARRVALNLFETSDIRWHGGDGEPSNHLLSSQVQCVNALAPFVNNPAALQRLFSPVLSIAEVLPFGSATIPSADRDDHVVFEWVGEASHLDEWTTAPQRGAYATSADAAIRYRAPAGEVAVALIEWKYTERYPDGKLAWSPTALATRLGRYQSLFDDSDGPIRHDVMPIEEFFLEPVYQLLRLQLLAWRMERVHELGADVVGVVYVAPAANDALWQSLPTPTWQTLGAGAERPLLDAWAKVLRRPDRFAWLDSGVFAAESAPTSDEFKARYGHLAEASTATESTAVADVNPDEVVASLQHLEMILKRVSGGGSVLENIIEHPETILALDTGVRREFLARSAELAELARYFRSDILSRAFDKLHPGSLPWGWTGSGAGRTSPPC